MANRRMLSLLACACLASIGTAAVFGSSSFLGAPAGQPVAFAQVTLPPVALPTVALARDGIVPATFSGSATGSTPSLSLWPFGSPTWAPPLTQLLNGNTVITTQAQMRDVWKRLFNQPFDASLFDFEQDVVLLMGGGQQQLGTFDISSVESVAAEYAEPLGGGPAIDPLLSVTATTVYPGAFPKDPPPFTWRVSAVRVSRADLDDAVFHRTFIALP